MLDNCVLVLGLRTARQADCAACCAVLRCAVLCCAGAGAGAALHCTARTFTTHPACSGLLRRELFATAFFADDSSLKDTNAQETLCWPSSISSRMRTTHVRTVPNCAKAAASSSSYSSCLLSSMNSTHIHAHTQTHDTQTGRQKTVFERDSQ
jgi:hypothetical protein